MGRLETMYLDIPVGKETAADMALAGYTGPGWYFWDEIRAHCYGPYKHRADAAFAESRFAEALRGR